MQTKKAQIPSMSQNMLLQAFLRCWCTHRSL